MGACKRLMLRAGPSARQAYSANPRPPSGLAAGTLAHIVTDANGPMKQHLAVSAIGGDHTGMVHELTRIITDCGGNIAESRMATLGAEFAMLLLVHGNWHALARIESELNRLADGGAISVHLRRTEPRGPRRDMVPYSIDIVSLDQAGIVARTQLFARLGGAARVTKLETSSATISAAGCGCLASATRCPAHNESAWIPAVVPTIGAAGSYRRIDSPEASAR